MLYRRNACCKTADDCRQAAEAAIRFVVREMELPARGDVNVKRSAGRGAAAETSDGRLQQRIGFRYTHYVSDVTALETIRKDDHRFLRLDESLATRRAISPGNSAR